MTFRPRLLVPMLIVSLAAFAALAAIPATARAEGIAWSAPVLGPADIPNGESVIPLASALNAVSFADATHGWAVGVKVKNPSTGLRYSFYEFTSDGGQSWTPGEIAGTAELYGVVARSTTDVWAVGEGGAIVHYNGKSWDSRVPTRWDVHRSLRAIAFSGQNGWAVGDGYGVAVTTDNGATWNTLPGQGTTGSLRAVAVAPGGANAFAVGDSAYGLGSAVMKRLTASGLYTVSSGASAALHGITFADAANGFAVGIDATIVRTSDGGTTWTRVSGVPLWNPTLAANRMHAVSFADALVGVAVGEYQTVWRTTDGGGHWLVSKVEDYGLGDYDLRGIAFVPGSRTNLVAVARSGNLTLTQGDQKSRAYRGTWDLPLSYTVSPTVSSNGALSPAQTVVEGGSAGFTATADIGYHVARVFLDLSGTDLVASGGIYTVTNVTSDHTISAVFALDVVGSFRLSYAAGPGGRISGTTLQTVTLRSSGTTVTAVPAAGYHFVSWSDDATTTAERTDTNVAGDISVTANFAANVIHTSLTIYANHSSAARGHLVYFYGTVAPNRSNGTKVEFWVRKAGSATWKRVSLRSTFSSHHWSYSYHPATRGTYYFKVRLWATSAYAASTSRYIKVTWR